MSNHQYHLKSDWIDAAAKYILDHSDVGSEDEARSYANDLAEQEESEHGPDLQDWASPTDSAHTMMAEDWPGFDGGSEDED